MKLNSEFGYSLFKYQSCARSKYNQNHYSNVLRKLFCYKRYCNDKSCKDIRAIVGVLQLILRLFEQLAKQYCQLLADVLKSWWAESNDNAGN